MVRENTPNPILNPKTLEEKELELTEIRARITQLDEEIARMEQETEGNNPQPKGNSMSRRRFLEIGVSAALGSMAIPIVSKKLNDYELGKKAAPDPNTREVKTREQIIQKEIEDCTRIILEHRYEEILQKPYLVSALYYSDTAMKKIGNTDQDAHKGILSAIYPLITKTFRDGYVAMLEKEFKKKKNIGNVNKEYLPLGRLGLQGEGENNHKDALDLFIKEGSPIFSMTDGVVVLAENDWEIEDDLSTSSMRGGNTVIIFNPNNGNFYRYAHMEKSSIQIGAIITGGEEIGIVGHTGINASKKGHGEHVHFEINEYNAHKGTMSAVDSLRLKKILKNLKRRK